MQINSYNCHKIKNTKFTALVTDDLPIWLKIANIFDLMLSYTSAIAGLIALAGNEIVPCSL